MAKDIKKDHELIAFQPHVKTKSCLLTDSANLPMAILCCWNAKSAGSIDVTNHHFRHPRTGPTVPRNMKKKWTFRRMLRMVWVAAGLTFIGWLFYSYQSHGVDRHWLEDGTTVDVEQTADFYAFTPSDPHINVLLFYPGAMVDPKAYVPLCRQIADSGMQVYLIRMPWRMAMYGYNRPLELGLLADTSKTYILAGHSQGAKMAAQFAYEHPGIIDKLILIGTTHPRDISLADRQLPVLKIYGSHDGVADAGDILANRSNLPADAGFVRIDGANHAQFGHYGFQFGDNSAAISRERQQAETLRHIRAFID